MMKRISVFALCFCLIVGFTAGCGELSQTLSSDETENIDSQQMQIDVPVLPYNEQDTLNPFSASTAVNLNLWRLMYEPLLQVDQNFGVQTLIAASVQMVDTTHIAVTLSSEKRFSDGSVISAADVMYSFRKAKESPSFAPALAKFQNVTAKGNVITFQLSSPDIYGQNCLCFPIVKNKTAEEKVVPTGSGAYQYQKDPAALVKNTYSDQTVLSFASITLKPYTTEDDMLTALENRSIHFLYNDLSDGNIPRTTAKTQAVKLNQLVYIGVNQYKAVTCTAAFRQAVSLALDRTVVAASSFAGRADASASPFHPNWQPGKENAIWSAAQNIDTAKTLYAQALAQPYAAPSLPETTTTATGETTTTLTTTTTLPTTATTTAVIGENRVFTLIYPAGNGCREAAVSTIKKQLAFAGITVDTVSLSFEEYTSRLASGNYDLYLGEIRLTPNMDLSPFFTAGGKTAFGVNTLGQAAQTYRALQSGQATMAQFSEAFQQEMPFIPLVFKQGMTAHYFYSFVLSPSAYHLFDGFIS